MGADLLSSEASTMALRMMLLLLPSPQITRRENPAQAAGLTDHVWTVKRTLGARFLSWFLGPVAYPSIARSQQMTKTAILKKPAWIEVVRLIVQCVEQELE
jgi:hypothetical protein